MFTILRSKSILTYEFASLTCCVDLNISEILFVNVAICIKPTILLIAAIENCLKKKQISVIAIE